MHSEYASLINPEISTWPFHLRPWQRDLDYTMVELVTIILFLSLTLIFIDMVFILIRFSENSVVSLCIYGLCRCIRRLTERQLLMSYSLICPVLKIIAVTVILQHQPKAADSVFIVFKRISNLLISTFCFCCNCRNLKL